MIESNRCGTFADRAADLDQEAKLLRPGRDDAGHAGVSDELSHVFVVVDDDAQVNPIHGGVAVFDVDFAGEVLWRLGEMGLLDRIERALQPLDDLGLRGHGLLHARLVVGGHFRAGLTEEPEVRDGDVHVDFAGGADAGRGTPGEFLGRRGFGQRDQLLRDVLPLAVVAFEDSLGQSLSAHQGRSEEDQ